MWALPEFHQFLDDFVNFETNKIWNWDNADMRPLTSTLDDTEWLKNQKIRCHIEDGNSRIRGINSSSSGLCGVLSFETLRDDGSFTIPVQRNNVPHGILSGRVSIDVFNPELESAIIQNNCKNNASQIQDMYSDSFKHLLENIKIHICGSKLMALEEKNPFTAYIIQINFLEQSWVIERRFRLFHDLHKIILDKMPFLRNRLPKFPEKTFGINKLSQNIVKVREAALSEYMKRLVKIKNVWNSAHFIHFIDNSEMLLLKKMHKIRFYRVAGILSRYEVLPTDPATIVGGDEQRAQWQGPGAVVGRQRYALSVFQDNRPKDMTESFDQRDNDFNAIRNKFELQAAKNSDSKQESSLPPDEGGITRLDGDGAGGIANSSTLFTNTGSLEVLLEEDENDGDDNDSEVNDFARDNLNEYTEATISQSLSPKTNFSSTGSRPLATASPATIPKASSENSIRFVKVDGGCVVISTQKNTGKVHLSFCRNSTNGNKLNTNNNFVMDV